MNPIDEWWSFAHTKTFDEDWEDLGLADEDIKPTPAQSSPFGSRLIAGMEELLATLEAGGMTAVEKKFTVRRVKKATFDKPALGKTDVVAIRTALGASQPVFASLLGVSPATVRAWEQGVNTPSGMALRFLAEIRANPDYWKGRLQEAAR